MYLNLVLRYSVLTDYQLKPVKNINSGVYKKIINNTWTPRKI